MAGSRFNHYFDEKFGQDFIKSVPNEPGVYRFMNDLDQIIYVGKAKALRKRLSQYRNATRKKNQRKMRSIAREATRIEFDLCDSEQHALLLENDLIKQWRPRFNWVGKHFTNYPFLGWARDSQDNLQLAVSSKLEFLTARGFRVLGSYRRREYTWNAFFGFCTIYSCIGHRVIKNAKWYSGIPNCSRIASFRMIPSIWNTRMEQFLTGQSSDFLRRAVDDLLERPSARSKSSEIQVALDDLYFFFRKEAAPLYKAQQLGFLANYPLPQNQRDKIGILLNSNP